FDHGGRIVGGTGGIGDHVVPGAYDVLVDPQDHHFDVLLQGGHTEDDLFGPIGQVVLQLFPGLELSGGLDHQVHVQGLPVQVFGVPVVQDGDFPSTDHNGVPLGLAMAAKGAVDAVVFEQVGQGPGIGQVVDGHD